MRQAVLYARVSSKDQEREGYSIPAQLKLLREYARTHDFELVREFVDVETAKTTGRKQFGEMVRFFRENPDCRIAIVEKTDRLYRNFRDCVTLEDLEVEIHLPKEGQVISKDAKSQAKLVHGIQVVIARNYIENLREEVRKGMREKAEQGIYPSRPPLGYQNNKLQHTIEVDPKKAPIARRMFQLYASGKYSLSTLRKTLLVEFGCALAKGYIDRLLKNPFYKGQFIWEGKLYPGTHTPLVPAELFEQVQAVFRGHNKPKYRRREFAFGGLLHCAYDDCMVTAELKKARYIYYHCTGYRGRCELPYFREETLADRLSQVVKNIHIPDAVLTQLEKSLLTDKGRDEAIRKQQGERLQQRLTAVRRRLDQAYLDKLDGKITEEFWTRKSCEWQAEEQQILLAVQGLEHANPDRMLDAVRTLELANKAHSLYLAQPPAEKAKLLRVVLSNCAIDAASVYPTYRKPFDLIFLRARNEEWRARRDSNPRPSGS
ncbi:MAG: recombinase family protein [Acidobacteria bacterium]|nr:recombinase family protein [Acidobacteriota bacterium]